MRLLSLSYTSLLILCQSSRSLSAPIPLKLKKLIYVHRHGDRTPITPLSDVSFWESTLPDQFTRTGISSATTVTTSSTKYLPQSLRSSPPAKHKAGGGPVFGMLTSLGILQCVKLGNSIRDEIATANLTTSPLAPKHVKVYSTNFPRTITSVQALLTGLFPEPPAEPIAIDASYTNIMIPDPQPRNSVEQAELEKRLAAESGDTDDLMLPLATKLTTVLQNSNILGAGAYSMSFGVGEEKRTGVKSTAPLAYAQLAEITKCLAVRDRLPPGITSDDQQQIMKFAATRWFHLLRDPRLAVLAMGSMVRMVLGVVEEGEEPVTVFSAHDSTLIGLICALRLRNPASWPEYASCFKVEVFEGDLLRFSLNGEVLGCGIGGKEKDVVSVKEVREMLEQ